MGRGEGDREKANYHVTQLAPLVQEVAVDVDTVRLAQVLGDEGADAGEVFLFQRVLVLDVSQLCGQFRYSFSLCHCCCL